MKMLYRVLKLKVVNQIVEKCTYVRFCSFERFFVKTSYIVIYLILTSLFSRWKIVVVTLLWTDLTKQKLLLVIFLFLHSVCLLLTVYYKMISQMIFHFLQSGKIKQSNLTEIFHQMVSLVISLMKTFLSRDFCVILEFIIVEILQFTYL